MNDVRLVNDVLCTATSGVRLVNDVLCTAW